MLGVNCLESCSACLDAPLDLAHRVQVLVHLAAVGLAEVAFQPLRVFQNEVQNALVIS